MSDVTLAPTPETADPQAVRARRCRFGWWVDVLIFIVLVGCAVPNRIKATTGDLWLDESDYAFAALRGYKANCWDAAPSGAYSLTLVKLRHFHPPFTAHAIGLGLRRGASDFDVRLPSVAAGALTVGLVYLCGLALLRRFSRRTADDADDPPPPHFARLAAAACAVIVIFTPPCVRASSHALPWPFVTFWLVALLWPLLEWCDSHRVIWLAVAGATLGGLFCTSEVFFVALLGLVLSIPFLIAAGWRRGVGWKRVVVGLLGFCVGFVIVVSALWPVGLRGGAVTMLTHYVDMAETAFPVHINHQTYEHAPKWAYLYWYTGLYPPLMMCYVLGFCTVVVLAIRRTLPTGAGVLMAMLIMLLVAAHRAHIIGPEYLAHVLPFLTLPVGLFFVAIYRVRAWPAVAVVVGCCLVCAVHRPIKALSGMDSVSRQPRWSLAAEAIKARWRPGDKMLAGQYGTAGRWYLVHEAGAEADDRSVQMLPIRSVPVHPETMLDIMRGKYRFIAVGSSLQAYPDVNQDVALLIARWPIVWRSIEMNGLPSRLTVYEFPPRVVQQGITKRSGRPRKESKDGRP